MMKIDPLLEFYHCPNPEVVHPLTAKLNLDENLTDVASSLFHLINTPENGQCILHMLPIIEQLLDSCADETGVELDKIMKVAKKAWRQLASKHQSNPQWGCGKPRNIRVEHPLFTFCFLGSAAGSAVAIPITGIGSGFRVLGPLLLTKLWKIKHEEYSDLYTASLAARKLTVMPIDLGIEAQFDLDEFQKLRIAKFAKNIQTNNKSFFTDNDMVFVRRMLFGGEKRHARKTDTGEIEGSEKEQRWLPFEKENSLTMREPCFDDSDVFDPGDGFTPEMDAVSGEAQVEIVSGLSAKSRTYRVLGEHDTDYKGTVSIGFPAHWFDPWMAKSGERGKIEAMTFSVSVMPWDKSCVSISALRNILNLFQEQSLQMTCGIIALTLFMGMPMNVIKGLRWLRIDEVRRFAHKNSKKLIDGDCFIDRSTGCIWAVTEKSEERDQYYKIPEILSLKLPDVLLEQIPKTGEVGESLFCDADLRRAARYMSGFGKDGISAISLARLRKTFLAYFVCGAGFPPLWADILAFRPSFHLNSQRYYVTSSLDGLEREWQRMLDEFIAGIRNNSSVKKILEAMSFRNQALSLYTDRLIGAARTPEGKAARHHFDELWLHFPHSKSELMTASDTAWNAYVGYLYGCYEVATGQRPARDPKLRTWMLQLDSNGVLISDKNNKKYSEARFLPLCPTLAEILRIHVEVHNHWVVKKVCEGYAMEGERSGFLLVDTASKSLVPFSQQKLDELMEGIVSDDYIKNIRNGFRHLLITCLHAADVDQPCIDFMAGHRHYGIEPEFWASPGRWETIAEKLSKTIETEIIQLLGLRVPVNE